MGFLKGTVGPWRCALWVPFNFIFVSFYCSLPHYAPLRFLPQLQCNEGERKTKNILSTESSANLFSETTSKAQHLKWKTTIRYQLRNKHWSRRTVVFSLPSLAAQAGMQWLCLFLAALQWHALSTLGPSHGHAVETQPRATSLQGRQEYHVTKAPPVPGKVDRTLHKVCLGIVASCSVCGGQTTH